MSIFKSHKNPVFFIAEIGGNHEGDFEYAKKLTRFAIESGADAVKFQIYSGDALVSRIESPERNKHFKKFELSREQYIRLAEMCRENGVMFMASVWDFERLAWADRHIAIHKIGSGDVTAYPLIKRLVETGKPIIMSTGLCTFNEVRETVEYIQSLDEAYITEKKLALLQCTASYPCPDEDANLNAMLLLRDEFGLPVGYSDHTIGNEAALVTATMGAEILEMHFTDIREGKEFRDHKISITRDEIRELLAAICKVKAFQGKRTKEPTSTEMETGHVKSFRRSVYAACDIQKGEVFTEKNLTILRPEHGLPAYRFDELLGRKALRDILEHDVLRNDDLSGVRGAVTPQGILE